MRFAWDLQALYLDTLRLPTRSKSVAARARVPLPAHVGPRGRHGVDRLSSVQFAFVGGREGLSAARRLSIYPPVDIERFTPGGVAGRYFLTGSRMNPFKRIDVVSGLLAQLPEPAARRHRRRPRPAEDRGSGRARTSSWSAGSPIRGRRAACRARGVRPRGDRGLRHRHGRGPGVRHAGDRSRRGRSQRDH